MTTKHKRAKPAAIDYTSQQLTLPKTLACGKCKTRSGNVRWTYLTFTEKDAAIVGVTRCTKCNAALFGIQANTDVARYEAQQTVEALMNEEANTAQATNKGRKTAKARA